MDYTIYLMVDMNGFYYIGSTTKRVCERFWQHKASSKSIHTPMMRHFQEVGWENVTIEEIEKGSGNKEQRLQRENEIIQQHLSDEYCLNKRRSLVVDKIQARRERGRRYDERNREKIREKNREYWRKRAESKQNKIATEVIDEPQGYAC